MYTKSGTALLLVSCMGTLTLEAVSPKRLPNVILLLSDDQGWGDLGFTGNRTVRTPNIDRIAEEGVIMENFYVCPVSSPTRAELLTGRYHVRMGVSSTGGGGERMDLGEKTIAEFFKEAGYMTGIFGKWHNGTQYPYHPNARGFDEFYGFCSGHWGNYWNPVLEHNGEMVTGNGFIADDLTDKALDFMKECGGRPFFMYVPYNTPHSPMQLTDSQWNLIKDRRLEQHADSCYPENETFTRAALGLAENLDWNIGRLLDAVKDAHLDDKTIIIYLSDNGPNAYRWNGGMKGCKGSTDEGGVRSPCCIRWPGRITPGQRVTQLSGAIDLIPTLMGMIGLKYREGKPLDGIDCSRNIFDPSAAHVERRLFSHWNNRVSVRMQDYLYNFRGHLYNTTKDRGQKKDLKQEEPDRYAKMKGSVEEFREKVMSGFSRKDNRPFMIGHPEERCSKLPARDARSEGAVERSNRFPNSSYFTNWKDRSARIYWDVEVVEEGTFDLGIYYTCDRRNIGSSFVVETAAGESLPFTLDKVNDSPMTGADLDRYPRMESYFKGFKSFPAGRIHLKKGRTTLSIRADRIVGSEAMNFWMMTLERVPEKKL